MDASIRIFRQDFAVDGIRPYRLNLVCVFNHHVYSAHKNKLRVTCLLTRKIEREIAVFEMDAGCPRPYYATDTCVPAPINTVRQYGNILLAVSDEGELAMVELDALEVTRCGSIHHSAWSIALHEKFGLIAVGGNDHSIHIVNRSRASKVLIELAGYHDHNIPSVDFTDNHLVSCSIDGSVNVFDIANHFNLVTKCTFDFVLTIHGTLSSDNWAWKCLAVGSCRFIAAIGSGLHLIDVNGIRLHSIFPILEDSIRSKRFSLIERIHENFFFVAEQCHGAALIVGLYSDTLSIVHRFAHFDQFIIGLSCQQVVECGMYDVFLVLSSGELISVSVDFSPQTENCFWQNM